MRGFKKVEGSTDLVRDEFSGGVLNTNTVALKGAKEAKEKRLAKLKETDSMRNDISKLQEDMSEIKSVLNKIAEKL